MAFSYLDPPNNCHHHHQLQQPNLHEEGTGTGNAGLLPPGKPAGSMSDRAKAAKPETALKCPRCESMNTKFCYFNNYNLSQPRHFCKTCRRYWTRGGSLRNVPVGGGCRRNKKITKKTTSKSRDIDNHAMTFVSSLQNLRGVEADQWMQNFPFLASGFCQTAAIDSNQVFSFENARSRVRGGEDARVEESRLGLSSSATSFWGNSNQQYYNLWGGGLGNVWNGSEGADRLPGQQPDFSGSGDATTQLL